MIANPPVVNCGSIYLLVTVAIGLTGLVVFTVAAKKYKYRVRDEGEFRQYAVEEIYDRYIGQSVRNAH